ncbi:MAG TPA: hypothetical protein VIT19_03075 [Pyrinomonadaceae bacterium]
MGEPITVGGGGGSAFRNEPVFCDFEESASAYSDQTAGSGRKHRTYANTTFIAKTLKVILAGETVDFSSLLPADGECKVEVKCPGSDDDVTITGKPLGIKLHTGTYSDPVSGSTNPHRRTGNSHSNEIEINLANQTIKIQARGHFEVIVEEE